MSLVQGDKVIKVGCYQIPLYCGGRHLVASHVSSRYYPDPLGPLCRLAQSLTKTNKVISLNKNILSLFAENLSKSKWQDFVDAFSLSDQNVMIGDSVVLFSRSPARKGVHVMPQAREITRTNNLTRTGYYPQSRGDCGGTDIYYSKCSSRPSDFFSRIRCRAVGMAICAHSSRRRKGHFNMRSWIDVPDEYKDRAGMVMQWAPVKDKPNFYVCFPIHMFGNPMHNRGKSWASFWYKTDDPSTLPKIQTGTLRSIVNESL